MSILDLHAPEMVQAGIDTAGRPPEPKQPKFSAWSAIPRGFGEAGLQVGASLSDVAAAFRHMRDATPEQRKQIDRGGVPIEAFSSETGDTLRDMGREFRSDPETAGMAEQVLYEFSRAAGKIVGGAVAGGVLGVGAMAAEEAFTKSDELRREGVGVTARSEAGLAQGAGLGLAALPLVGQTWKATAALYAVGGPGGFMAQQAATREILRNAGHDKLAEQYDPFDPLGLALSALLPLPFVGYGLRKQGKARAAQAAEDFRTGPIPSEPTAVARAAAEAVPREVVDAAMVHNLTLARGSADERAALMVEHAGRPVESLGQFVERGGFKPADPVKAPAGPDPFLAWIKQNGGIDFAEKYDITGEKSGVLSNPAGIFRKGGAGPDDLARIAAEAGYLLPDQAGDSGALRELVKRAVNGERVLTFEQQNVKAARDYADAQNAARVADLEHRLDLLGVDAKAARGNADAMEAYLRENEGRLFAAAMDEVQSARRGDAPEVDAMQERAKQIAQDMRDGERTLAQYEAEVEPLSPVMRKLVREAEAQTAADSGLIPMDEAGKAAAQRDIINHRKQAAVLKSLLECLDG